MLSADRTVDDLRAAGEPSRLRILALLAREELAVLEICKVLDQSQPRVSRHLRLLAEAGLVERFPDGAWVFYRPAADGECRTLADRVLAAVDGTDPVLVRDAERLEAVRGERRTAADQYFARNAATWDEIRSLHVAEDRVEAVIRDATGPGPFHRLVDLGTGSGRMLTLLGPRATSCLGLDLSQQMLNVARARVEAARLPACDLRHGDIFATRLPDGCADLVVVHQVLHYLGDPAAAVREAGRLAAPGGRLVIVDFAPHALEVLREQHQHRRLGFSAPEMKRWLSAAGLRQTGLEILSPARSDGLTVCVWTAERSPS